MSVTRAEIQRIANLAELAVDDAAAAELETQLNRILGYVEQLRGLPAGDEAAEDPRVVRLRKDEPNPDPLSRPPAEWAPAMKGGLFTVPRLGELDRGDDE